jgi:hypothetical protein
VIVSEKRKYFKQKKLEFAEYKKVRKRKYLNFEGNVTNCNKRKVNERKKSKKCSQTI